MNAIRSVVFNLFYTLGSGLVALFLLPALLLPTKKCAVVVSEVYGGYIRLITRWIMGLKLNIEGLENLPKDGPYILAAKHQSAFETLTIPFARLFRYPVIILKESLTRIPLWGMYFVPMGQIPIDRGTGREAMNKMTDGCKRALGMGRSIIIFPQGTRVAPGAVKPYKAGLAKLYKDLHVPIVPLALNTGVFWGRNSFFKKSGTITFKILPALPANLPPLKVMEQLEKTLEEESDKLVQAAGGPALGKN